MEPKENSIPTGIVVLWGLLFLFQLLASQVTSALAPTNALPGCPQRCGDVEIPYPFGIGPNCSREGFTLNCTHSSNGTHKPFLHNVELLNISLSLGQARVANRVSRQCYNATSRNVTVDESWYIDLTDSPYRFSNTLNKFTAVGCDTVAYILAGNTADDYWSGCISLCEDQDILRNGSCSGIGCCQTSIAEGIDYYSVWFDDDFNSSGTYNFSPCSYAVLAETTQFNFSTSYITTDELQKIGNVQLVLDWAVRNKTCREAKQNKTSYACVSDNSVCVDSTNDLGYLCNCSKGYQGNPYLRQGCQDINECANKENPPCSGACTNTPGNFLCSCPRGKYGNPYSDGACYLNQTYPSQTYPSQTISLTVKLIIGTSIGLTVFLVMSLCAYIIYERKKLSKVKKKFFQQHGGRLLLEEIRKQQGLAFTIFTKEELEEATNKFDKNNILGQGGHGTVYKGTLKDDHVVAIKNPTIINEAQKKEFGKEMLILSQINHKNIVKILGCSLEMEVPMLVYEFIPNGTLFQLIHRKNLWALVSLETRLQIALDSAEALAYLHSSASPPIIHGDVKSSNILLDDHLNAKVSDFGASTLAPTDETQFVTLVQGTCGYLDPEYLQTCQLTDKSDVYSFGVVLLELLTGRKALYFEGPEEDKSLSSSFLSAAKEDRVWQLIDYLIRNEEDKDLIEEVAELAMACLNVRGEERPSMKEVAEELNRLRKLKQHPWEQNPEEMESLLGESQKYQAEESTSYLSLEKKSVLSIGPGR